MITLTAEQQSCADAIRLWDEKHQSFQQAKQVFRVDGYAGTGKSTLIQQVVADLPGLTLFAAYTGKAALVMQSKGCTSATTIHKLIYLPAGTSGKNKVEALKKELSDLRQDFEGTDEEFSYHPQGTSIQKQIDEWHKKANSPLFNLNPDSDLSKAARLVVDEMSMCGGGLAQDLLSFGVPVIVLGDPGQLPPVMDEGYFTQGDADFTLTQIHRQAADSPILKLATLARQRKPIAIGEYGNCRVVGPKGLTSEMALEADQILCGRNKTRHLNNARMRQLLGFSGTVPCAGEKLVCRRNDTKAGFLNGGMWRVVEAHTFSRSKVSLTLVPDEGGAEVSCLAHSAFFTGYDKSDTDPKWVDNLQKDEKNIGFDLREAQCFNYGYVITVHSGQGSQWNNVLVLDESDSFGGFAPNHLYTAITRAAEKVTIRL